MRRFKGYGPLISVAVLGLILVLMSQTIADWFAKNRSAYNGAVIGKITHVEGSVRRIHGANIDLLPTVTSGFLELRDGDRLQTSVQSKADILLNSKDQIEVPAGCSAMFQLWDKSDPGSPIYVSTNLGQIHWHTVGVRGKAYLVKDGRLYLPGQKPLEKPMALTVLRSAPLDMHLAANEPVPAEFQSDTENTPVPPATSNPLDPDTLSNEYIDEQIAAHQTQLQKCWLSRLKDAPGLKGQITLQFQISKRGKAKDVRIADSSLEDDTLKNCVISVIERVPFRSFKGAEISLSYPITFE